MDIPDIHSVIPVKNEDHSVLFLNEGVFFLLTSPLMGDPFDLFKFFVSFRGFRGYF